MVQAEKRSTNWTPEMFSGCEADAYSVWTAKIRMYVVNTILVGYAEKEQFAEEKKLL